MLDNKADILNIMIVMCEQQFFIFHKQFYFKSKINTNFEIEMTV